jgi:hypothetical protein
MVAGYGLNQNRAFGCAFVSGFRTAIKKGKPVNDEVIKPICPYLGKLNQVEQQEPVVPQLEQPDVKSIPQSTLKPLTRKSTLIGSAFIMNSLSTTYLKPSISKTSSVSFDSSRAIAKLGPPHPPSFKKIRMGETSLPLKYSAICSVADGVTSIMTPSCRDNK